jgi:hypothetical protein
VIAVPRRSRLFALGALVAVLVALAATLSVDDVQAVSYKSCVLSDSFARPVSGKPTYNLIVKQSRTTCATAKKVVDAFHDCRATTAASCKKTLLGHWRCKGKQESSTPVLFYGTFNCTYGKRAVRSSYQQNTD